MEVKMQPTTFLASDSNNCVRPFASYFFLSKYIDSTQPNTDGDKPLVNDKFLFIFSIFWDLLPTRLMYEWFGALI